MNFIKMSLNERFNNYIYTLNLKQAQYYFLLNKIISIIYKIIASQLRLTLSKHDT